MSALAPSPGDALSDLDRFFKLEADWTVCRVCKRPQQVHWCHFAFPHAAGCKNEDEAPSHPWLVLSNAVTCARSALPPQSN